MENNLVINGMTIYRNIMMIDFKDVGLKEKEKCMCEDF